MKEMYKNIEAAEILGMPTHKIRQEIEKRKGIKRNIIDNIMRGQYTPHEPSEFFIDRVAEINRELNSMEGVTITNPYYQAAPYLREIIQSNRRLNLLNDEMNLPEQDLPDPAGPLQEKAEDLYRDISLSVTGTPQSYPLDSGIVSAFNRGTGDNQVNEVTGLTYVEDSLLKPWEKILKQKERTT